MKTKEILKIYEKGLTELLKNDNMLNIAKLNDLRVLQVEKEIDKYLKEKACII